MNRHPYLNLLVIAVALLLATACDDDTPKGMRLEAEGFNQGNKLAVSGITSAWVSGETLRINGTDKTITVDGGDAYISDVDEAEHYRAIYPASLNTMATLDDDVVTVDLPHTYQWATDGNGRQLLPSPMVAHGTSGSRLRFYHLTSAIDVTITNYYGFTVTVDSVVISSDLGDSQYQLSGSRSVTLATNEAPTIDSVITSTAADRRVKMLFSDSELRIMAGETRVVQIPVLPVGTGNKFTVTVVLHKVDDPAVVKDLTRTQATGGRLPRARLATACDTVGGLFSVASGRKVIISQGNLQYQASTGIWRFAEHQYDMIGSGNTNASSDYSGWIDLFGWGTSGWNNGNICYQPFSTSNAYSGVYASSKGYGYGPTDGSRYEYDLIGEYVNADWGEYNKIVNGGNQTGQWRTMTGNAGQEWQYLIGSRSNASRVGSTDNAKFVQASVNGVYGTIIFPDIYIHPDGVAQPVKINVSSSLWTTNVYTSVDWAKIEAAGAVFLPRSGYRYGQVYTSDDAYYWSSTHAYNSDAYATRFGAGGITVNNTAKRCYGYAVRLVKDVE